MSSREDDTMQARATHRGRRGRPTRRSGLRRVMSAALAGVLGVPLAGIVGLAGAGPAHAVGPGTPQSVTIGFDPTGQATWTVPADTYTVTVTGVGGSGGDGATSIEGGAGGAGGVATKVTLTMDVSPGQLFNVYPGQAAQGSTPGWAADSLTGGSGGQGDVLASGGGTSDGGAGGSGTEVDTNSKLVLVAGGGGGGGGGGSVQYGGGFGGYYGFDGESVRVEPGGGAGGADWLPRKTGQSATDAPLFSYAGGGGGGGGGWSGTDGGGEAGATGGYGGAGGAGGLYGDSNAFMGRNVAIGAADATGDGSVVFSWTPGADAHATFTASANPAPNGGSVTFTDTIAPTSATAPTPTGTVTFEEYDFAASGYTTLAVVPLVGGTATWTTSGLPGGTHYLYAVSSGDSEYLPLTAALVETVTAGTVTSALTVGPNPSVAGDAVTFTDRVTPTVGGPIPTGTVTFDEYNPSTGALTILGAAGMTSGVATLTSTDLAVGSHAVYAVYSGDVVYGGGSSLFVTEVVDAAVMSVSTSANPVAFGPQVVGTTQTQVVTVTNNGNVAVTFNGHASTTNGDVNLPTTSCVGPLAAGASCTATVSFGPSVTGPDNGTITLSGTYTVSLNVTGVGVAAVQSVTATPNPVAFGDQPVGTTQTQVVTVTNTGNVAVAFSGASTNNLDVNRPASTCGALAPGASCTVTVSFGPSVTGPDNGTITLLGTYNVSLNVTGVGVAVPTVDSVSPRSGRKAGGTTITVRGHGLSDVTAITVAGVAVKHFSCPSPSRCTAVTAAGNGSGPVLVTNIAGTSPSTPAAQFRYR